MTLDQNSGKIITEAEAKTLINAFKVKYPNESTSSFIGSNNVQNILQQEGCIGIRVYNGFDVVSQTISLVLVGVDAREKDMLAGGIIYDQMIKCPTKCPIDGLGF